MVMKKMTKALAIITGIGILTSPVCTALQQFSQATGLPFFIPLGILCILFLITPRISGVHSNGIQVEIWERDIIGNLFKNNDFLLQAYNADQYVLQGKD